MPVFLADLKQADKKSRGFEMSAKKKGYNNNNKQLLVSPSWQMHLLFGFLLEEAHVSHLRGGIDAAQVRFCNLAQDKKDKAVWCREITEVVVFFFLPLQFLCGCDRKNEGHDATMTSAQKTSGIKKSSSSFIQTGK